MPSPPSVLPEPRLPPAPAGSGASVLGRGTPARGAAFDVCHPGVVLRTVVFTHGAVAVALLPGSDGVRAWLSTLSLAFAVVLPGTLVWLLALCAGQAALARAPRWGRWLGGLALGALCGTGTGLAWRFLHDALFGAAEGVAVGALWVPGSALCGAALATGVLHWLEQRVRMLESPGTAARLAELQSRIRPHFLFNALNSAIALVAIRPEQAEQVLEDLAELFRAALSDAREQVTLREELALAQRYLAVEQVRFAERLRLQWTVEPAATAALVPPLVLQPLVENAVKHGVEEGASPGDVQVQVRCLRGERAEVLVRNRLPSRAAGSTAKAGARGLGMALVNVRERLHLMHDVALRFEAGEVDDGWWEVRFVVPLPGAPGG